MPTMAVTPKMLLILVVTAAVVVSSDSTRMHANPVRRVILLLQSMMKQSEESSVIQETTFDMFMCQCKKSMETLLANIAMAKEAIPPLKASIAETTAKKLNTAGELMQAKIDKKDLEASLEESTARRVGEKTAYDAALGEMNQNIGAMIGAAGAISSALNIKTFMQMRAGFLQTSSARFLQGLLATGKPEKKYDRDVLAAFLETGGRAEGSGEILGILEQMKADMINDKIVLIKVEKSAQADFNNLESIKISEIKGKTERIADLDARLSTYTSKLVNDKATLKSLADGLESDIFALSQQKISCGNREHDYGIMRKQFATERIALGDTIKILASDESADLFKSTAVYRKGSSFLQVGSSSGHRRKGVQTALDILQDTSAMHPEHGGLSLLARHAAAASKHGFSRGFDKIVGQIEGMLGLLVKEGKVELLKKDNCIAELHKNNETLTQTLLFIELRTADLAVAVGKFDAAVAQIAKLVAEKKFLDAAVKMETAQRVKEHKIYMDVRSMYSGQLEILEVAKNRLAEFYTSSFVQGPETHAEDAPAFLQDESSDESGGTSRLSAKGSSVVKALKRIMGDIKAEFGSAKAAEDKAQKEYQESIDTKNKRGTVINNEKSDKLGEKAEHETSVKNLKDRIIFRNKELTDTNFIIKNLHDNCDWIMAHFKQRVMMRKNEADGLKNAMTLLCADKKTTCNAHQKWANGKIAL